MEGMTGIGKGFSIKPNLRAEILLKSVNHRALDFHISLPPYMAELEPALRSKICLIGANSISGKEMDFTLQEISREFNTILSKSRDIKLSTLALKGKSTVETLREQTFNIQ